MSNSIIIDINKIKSENNISDDEKNQDAEVKFDVRNCSFDELKKYYINLLEDTVSLRKEWLETISDKSDFEINSVRCRTLSLLKSNDDLNEKILNKKFPRPKNTYSDIKDELNSYEDMFIYNKIEAIKKLVSKLNKRILYVLNLDESVDYQTLYDIYSEFGNIIWIQLDKFECNKKWKYFAKIWYTKEVYVENAIKSQNLKSLKKKDMLLNNRNFVPNEYKLLEKHEKEINVILNLPETERDVKYIEKIKEICEDDIPYAKNIKCEKCNRECYLLLENDNCCYCVSNEKEIDNNQFCPCCYVNIY
jgi:RNA recognition motif-containing protein